MYIILISVIIGLVVALAFVNVYFRVRVFKYYKSLIASRVEFDLSHILNRKKLEKEILPNYPSDEENILAFVNHLKISARIAMILFVLISLFGWVLMHYR